MAWVRPVKTWKSVSVSATGRLTWTSAGGAGTGACSGPAQPVTAIPASSRSNHHREDMKAFTSPGREDRQGRLAGEARTRPGEQPATRQAEGPSCAGEP